MREGERTMCEIEVFWGFFYILLFLTCLLMKGLKAAFALLKEEIVVSDKV